jgi:secernin
MCDTMVALGNSTADGSVLFAKNSDREPNEGQYLELIPSAEHESGSMVRCTYMEIPQVIHTRQVFLSKPFWMWGAEIGANENGVVIGNEAVFSKVPGSKKPGLIGMDLLRLGLERGTTAQEAMQVIIQLLEMYGQSGNCSNKHDLYYHNSYLIADPQEAWILESVDRQWAAVQVKSVGSISNALTIEREWDLCSADLVKYAVDRKWCKGQDDFSFARCYSDFLYTTFADGRKRQSCSLNELNTHKGQLDAKTMFSILRSHGSSNHERARIDRALIGADICWHAGFGPIRASQTTGSMVSHITPELTTHWVTGTSAPCTSIFKPVWMDAGLPDIGLEPGDQYDPDSMFWQHELVHRSILLDYPNRIDLVRQESERLENESVGKAKIYAHLGRDERLIFSKQAFNDAITLDHQCMERLREKPLNKHNAYYYDFAWRKFNKQANLPELS